jgi:hypothetical protein
MIWATRVMDAGEDAYVRELFCMQRAVMGNPRYMMLVKIQLADARQQLYVHMYDFDLMPSYYGFTRISHTQLPPAPELLEGDTTAFEELFHSWGGAQRYK